MRVTTLQFRHVAIVCLLPFFLISCYMAPLTKEMYLYQYTNFVECTELEYPIYRRADWVKYDKEHHLFSKVYYRKFRIELTRTEREKVRELDERYQHCRKQSRSVITSWF